MIKEKDILIRVDEELKKNITEKAKSKGLSLSSYVRMLIVKDLQDDNI
jgi:antitoxin component of RelBE/YafQ-DinJ toxin-antitoxin module